MVIKIYFDGACNNHLKDPCAGVGVAVFINDRYSEEDSRAIAIMPNELGLRNTNNTTEWQACIQAMLVMIDLLKFYPKEKTKYEVYSDSRVVSEVFNGVHQTHTPEFKTYKKIALEILAKTCVGKMNVQWISREQNKKADELSKEGIKLAESKLE